MNRVSLFYEALVGEDVTNVVEKIVRLREMTGLDVHAVCNGVHLTARNGASTEALYSQYLKDIAG